MKWNIVEHKYSQTRQFFIPLKIPWYVFSAPKFARGLGSKMLMRLQAPMTSMGVQQILKGTWQFGISVNQMMSEIIAELRAENLSLQDEFKVNLPPWDSGCWVVVYNATR